MDLYGAVEIDWTKLDGQMIYLEKNISVVPPLYGYVIIVLFIYYAIVCSNINHKTPQRLQLVYTYMIYMIYMYIYIYIRYCQCKTF